MLLEARFFLSMKVSQGISCVTIFMDMLSILLHVDFNYMFISNLLWVMWKGSNSLLKVSLHECLCLDLWIWHSPVWRNCHSYLLFLIFLGCCSGSSHKNLLPHTRVWNFCVVLYISSHGLVYFLSQTSTIVQFFWILSPTLPHTFWYFFA